MKEQLAIVDKNDNLIGKGTWDDVRNKNLAHRATGILVFNKKGELLVHRRSRNFNFYPRAYSICIGGGVGYNETYEENAVRELEEETGIKGAKLKFLFKDYYETENSKVCLKIYECLWDGKLKIQEEELEDVEWMPISKVKELMKGKEIFPSNLYVFNKYMKDHYDKTI